MIMTFECISSAIVTLPESYYSRVTVHQKHEKPSIFSAILSEKAEEETEKSEEERDKSFPIELADFSQIVSALSWFHSPLAHFRPFEHKYTARPRLFTLFCVYLI
jgi:hypothetical protein